ncbi:MAG: Nif11-like leader peptide family natural product precursor [Desulfovermiculus sp.]
MSIEQAQAAIEKMKQDQQFREKIMALETLEERVSQLKAEGFDCTVDELRSMYTQMSEEELEGIAAGTWCTRYEMPPYPWENR